VRIDNNDFGDWRFMSVGSFSLVGYGFLLEQPNRVVVFGFSFGGDYELDEKHTAPQKRAAHRICCG